MAITGSIMTAIGAIAAGAAKVGGAVMTGAKVLGGTLATGAKAAMTSSIGGAMAKGAVVGGLLNAGTTAVQGGNFKDITKAAATGAGIGAATGAVGKGIGALGSKVQGLLNIGNKGIATGGAASINEASAISNIDPKTGIVYKDPHAINFQAKMNVHADPNLSLKSKLPIGTAPTNITNATSGQTTSNVGTKLKTGLINIKNSLVNSGNTNITNAAENTSAPVPGAGTPAASTPKTFLNNVKTGLVKAGTAVKNKAGQIDGQVILQGGLSLITAGMGAKTAKEANEVSRQSLLFQQQTYQEQKAEQDKKEARLKDDAWKAYSSANSFGENLYGNGTNSLLFTTDYKTNPTGNFSILSGNTAKLTDYT